MRSRATRDQVIKRWAGTRAAEESYPKRLGTWADEDHVQVLAELCTGVVCEVGCGTGRCCEAFAEGTYVGVDINGAAVQHARTWHPEHDFRHIGWDDAYPEADTYLFHTCLMHVPNEELAAVLVRAKPRIVIYEVMEPLLNRRALVWHRSVEDYVYALERSTFDVTEHRVLPTLYQPRAGITLQRHFMVGEESQ